MTRTGLSPRLSQHFAEPYAEIHPTDGARLRIADADLVRVSTPAGSILVRALLSARQAPGSIFVPIHWTDQFASAARVDRLVPALTDPWSGQPASKHVAAHLERASIGHYGFAVVREKPRGLETDYWALARCRGGWRIELGDADADRDWDSFAATLLVPEGPTDMLSYRDSAGGQRRFAAFRGDGLAGALFLAPEPVAVSRDWAAGQLTARFATPRERLALIAGRPGRGEVERGATVCSCLGIGRREIVTAIAAGASTVDAIGRATQAGTNCGSCRAEIRGIIDAHLQAAE
jgi:assimilatory nitrate reductase catalytic subunit